MSSNPQQMLNIVPDTNLGADLESGSLANYVFIAPDQCHDLRGLSICSGGQLAQETDAYLKTTVDLFTHSQVWREGRNALVVTFDEGDANLGCCDGGDDPFRPQRTLAAVGS